MSFVTTTAVLASAVANAGTVAVTYPSGSVQGDFTGVNASATGVVVVNENEVYTEAASQVSISYGASSGTITNNSGVSWPAGSTIRVQFGKVGNDRPGFQPSDAIAALTDSSGGTVSTTLAAISGTYSQAEVRNSIASLNAQMNRILIALRAQGVIDV